MRTQHQHLRVFLEGIEFFGVNSVTITEQIGMPASCEITTNYKSRLHNVLPKTTCHVFYKYNDDYVLIFEGELTGIGFEKNAMQKAAKLQFTGLSLNWRNHYVIARDTFSRFDKGAFLVANAELPFTYTDEPMHINQLPEGTWLNWYESSINTYLAKEIPGTNDPKSSLTRSDLNTILERTTPLFRKDVFWALARKEGAVDLHFSRGLKNLDGRPVGMSEYYIAKLETQPTPYVASQLYSYPLNGHKRNFSVYSEIAWGILQVMGFNLALYLTDNLQQSLLINGLTPEYRSLVKSVTDFKLRSNHDINVNADSPIDNTDFLCFKDLKSGKLFPIPSEPLLFALQCKAAWNLLTARYQQIASETFTYSKQNTTAMFASWLGKVGTRDAYGTSVTVYGDEVYQYFIEANKFFFPDNTVNTIYGPEPVSTTTITYDDKAIKLSNQYPQWLKSFVEGAGIAFNTKTLLSQELKNTDLSQLVSGILSSLELTSSYYSRVSAGFKLDGSRVSIVDNEPARRLFSLNGFTEYALQQAASQEQGVMSGMDLLRVFSDVLNYNIYEYAAPINSNLTTAIMVPETTFMTPILPNTFFSDQLNDFTFTRQLEREPTRYVAYTNALGVLGNPESNSVMDFRFTYVTPKIPDTNSEANFIKTNKERLEGIRQYTYEETWRGVHALQGTQGDVAFEEILFKMFEPENSDEPNTMQNLDTILNNPTASGFLHHYWKSMMDGVFLRKRYEARTGVLTTVYNPHRVCGFPGIIIDDELPAVIGKITSIASTISADGQSVSQISLSHCHTHWDSDLEQPQVLGIDAFQNSEASGVYNYMKDAVPAIDHIYKFLWDGSENKYRWYNIGKQIYGPLLGTDTSVDYSLLRFADANKLSKQNDSEQVLDWENYAKALASSIKNLRKLYNSFHNKHVFSDKVIEHDLMTFNTYWTTLLGSTELQSNAYADTSLWLQEYQLTRNNPKEVQEHYKQKPFSTERRAKISEFINAGLTKIEGNPNAVPTSG